MNAEIQTTETTDNRHARDMSYTERTAEAARLADAAGLRLPKTRVPEGESLWDVGEKNRRALEGQIEALPDAADGLAALRERIRREDPQDYDMPVGRVRLGTGSGEVRMVGGQAAQASGYTRTAFGQLAAAVKPADAGIGWASTLLALPPAIRAQAFNWAADAKLTDRPAVVRTLVEPVSGRRVIRALVSDKHSQTTGDDKAVADALQQMTADTFLGGLKGAKLRVTRDHDRTDLEILWPAMAREIKTGDLVKIGVRVSNSETKRGSLVVAANVLRVLCYNFTTIESADEDAEEIRLIHVGDMGKRIEAAMVKALKRVEPFVLRFADAYREAFPAGTPTRGELLAKAVRVLGVGKDTAELAAKVWDADGDMSAGDTLAGLVNALTRASQTLDMAEGIAVEKAAGKLIARGFGVLDAAHAPAGARS